MERKTVVDAARASPIAALNCLFTAFLVAVCKTGSGANNFAAKAEKNEPTSRRSFLGLGDK